MDGPGKFEEDFDSSTGHVGMYFCKNAIECFKFYDFDPANKVAEVIAYGEVKDLGDRYCTDKLEIVREVTWVELLEIINSGEHCTGICNSGNYNSGRGNSGYRNSGDWNNGSYSSSD